SKPFAAGNKASLENENIRIDYTNSKEGMRQDFIIKEKPAGDDNLKLIMNVRTNLEMNVSKEAVTFRSKKDGSDKMNYSSLKAWDANGKILNAYFDKQNDKQFSIRIIDKDAQYPVTVDPLSSTPSWSAEGDQEWGYFGWSVSDAGDVNGDGYSDVIIGAPSFDNGQSDEGRAFVYNGSANGLSPIANWTAESNREFAYFGFSVSKAGDVNGDGYSDVIVGSYGFANGQTEEGKVYVYQGSASGLSVAANWTAESDQSYAHFGRSVSTAGDVNDDGYNDVIVGAFLYDNDQTDEGRIFVYHGSPAGLSETANWIADSDQSGSEFGLNVSCAGDVNKDGYSDVVIGAPGYDNGEENEGRAFVYHGTISGLNTTADWTAESNQENSHFGFSVSSAGDVNYDGYYDVIIGAYLFDNGETDEGRAFVYLGSSYGLSASANWAAESDQANAYFGTSVSTAGDLNVDGYSDVIIGSFLYDNGETNEGRVFVYYGSYSGLSDEVNWTAESNLSDSYFGYSVSSAGDVNKDGFSDLLIGAYHFTNGQLAEGKAFVYYGSTNQISLHPDWTGICDQENARYGFSVSGAGDVNNDGFDDVIIGAPTYNNGESDVGKVFVYYGSQSGLSQIAQWSSLGNGLNYGYRVSEAGDVNNDGYDDILIATFGGGVFSFLGSQNGLVNTPHWISNGWGILQYFGYSLSPAGDYNGDGYDDIIVGCLDGGFASNNYFTGAMIFFGSENGLISIYAHYCHLDVPNYSIQGFGRSVACAGDVNGNGQDEVIVGAPGYYQDGAAFVYSASAYFGGIQSIIFWPYIYDFGSCVNGAGDVDNDGFDDVMINDSRGVIRTFRGSSQGVIEPEFRTDTIDNVNFKIGDFNGDGFKDILTLDFLYFGKLSLNYGEPSRSFNILPWHKFSSDFTGDVNGDGFDDIIIGTQIYTSYVFYGKGLSVSYINITPRFSHLYQGSELCLEAKVTDQFGQIMENKEVTFKVNGANPDTVIILTNNTGIAKFCYFGINPGNDTITAIAGGLQNQARVFWDFPTPVELSAFTSSVLGRNVTLNWSTSSEFNNSDFDIERSSTENNWIKAGFIRGHGTISEPQNYSFTDKNLTTGKYKYRLKQIDFNGNFEYYELAEEVSIGIPDKYELSQNYPNPFNPVTNLEFGISNLGFVTLKIYDVLGRELVTLVNEIKEPGYYKIKFNAGNLSSGVYFYRMEA
ncbi:MAG: FG-GAP-like repeat-containing protein, partial [Ignavibacteria bacterium]